MGNLWLKIKVWSKAILFGALLLYILLFVYNNSTQVQVWWWFKHKIEGSTLLLLAVAYIAGVISAILVRTTIRTVRQVQELRDRSRIDRLERETAEQRAKAARLQTKPPTGAPDAEG